MKQNRYIPFGYHIQNGVLCIHDEEAAVVRRVFEDYQHGLSYRLIAEKLTVEKIPYLENRTSWNKHMVKRMLENFRYCGGSHFPAIVPATTFAAVNALVEQKSQVERLPDELACIRRKAIVGLVEPNTHEMAEANNMRHGAVPLRGVSPQSVSPTKPCWTS